MATPILIPVTDYLSTTYRPDRDYVDGELKERNMGEEAHAEVQAILARIIGNHRNDWGVRVLTEVRVQTSETHYRIPDVCVVPSSRPRGRIIQYPPMLCIEILSPEDRIIDLQQKIIDFSSMGIEAIWVIDPVKRIGYQASAQGLLSPVNGMLRVEGTPIQVALDDVFAELDEE